MGKYCQAVLAIALLLSALGAYAAGGAGTLEIERAVAVAAAEIDAAQAKLKDRCSLLDYRALARNVCGTNIWTDALQRAIDEHEIVSIPASDEKYFIDGPVVLPSNRRIEASGATIRLADGVKTLMLRNASARDGTLAPAGAAGPRDSNIAIVGGRWEDWCARRGGNGRNGAFDKRPLRRGDFLGVFALAYFGCCDHVSVQGATFANAGGFAVQAGDADALRFEDVRFDRCHADGLHLNGNLTRVLARRVKGQVGDDLVALNAYDWLRSSVNFGPQRHILCEDLTLERRSGVRVYPAIRIQPAKYRYDDGSIVDCSVSDVIFRRVRGITTFKMYLQTPPYAIGAKPEWSETGSGGNIFFEDVKIDLDAPIDGFREYVKSDPVRGHFGAFEIGADISSVTFRDVEVAFHADKYPLSHLVTVGPKSCVRDGRLEVFDPYVSCRVGRVALEDVRVRGAAPAELVHATAFDDVNGDGRSSGRGEIGEVVRREAKAGLREAFRSPKGDVRGNIGPFLWMHGTESEERIREYIGVLDAGGQNTVTLESRPHDGWMADAWWRDVDIAIDECRKRGMKAIIYDDYWFPSQGFGAMFPIPREFQCRDVKAEVFERGAEPAETENEIARAAAKETAKGVFDLRSDGDKMLIYRWTVADPGNIEGLKRGRNFPFVNGLDAAAVDWFLDRFYKPYWDRYRSAFEDGTIVGYFFDEPYTKGWWGPELEKEIAARGEDAAELLTALRFRHADAERQARAAYRFHDLRAEVWGRTMFGRHGDWCRKRGVFSSGHFFEHGQTHYDFTFSGGNVMQLLKYVDVPGIDLVCRQVYPDMRGRRNVEIDCGQMPKYCSSLAHVYNRWGGLNWCETFGGYGQGLSYPDMKWLADWMHAQGCHFFVPHSFNMKAPLDCNYPPYFYNGGYEPRFPLYRVWADFSNRIALMLSGTGHVCRVAQIMPGMSFHVGRTIRPEMFAFAVQDALLDGDFMDYAAAEVCVIGRNPRTGRPAVRAENGVEWYDVLVLPAAEYVPYATLEKALAFAKAGGVIVGYGIVPSNTPTRGRTAKDAKRIVAEIFAQKTAVFLGAEPDGPALRAALAADYPGENRPLAADYPGEKRPLAVRDFDFEGMAPEDGKNFGVKLCEKDGAMILFVANRDLKRGREVKVRSRWAAEGAEVWRPMSGSMEKALVEGGLARLSLAPAESAFVVWPGTASVQQQDSCCSTLAVCPEKKTCCSTLAVRPTTASVQQQGGCTLAVYSTPVSVEEGPEYQAAVALVKPLEGAQWIWHPGPRSPGRDHVTLRKAIALPCGEEVTLTFACASAAKVFVNGKAVAEQTGGAEPDFRGWSNPVKTKVALRAGRNEIRVEAWSGWNTERRKAAPAGFIAAIQFKNGKVIRTGEGEKIRNTGSDALRSGDAWEVCRKGGEFVAAAAVCRFGEKPMGNCILGPTRSQCKESVATECRFTLPPLNDGDRVFFECDGTERENAAAVEVNGAYAGGFICKPYSVDITDRVLEGENTLLAKPFRLKNPRIVIGRRTE